MLKILSFCKFKIPVTRHNYKGQRKIQKKNSRFKLLDKPGYPEVAGAER
jgi:hypothetical protein